MGARHVQFRLKGNLEHVLATEHPKSPRFYLEASVRSSCRTAINAIDPEPENNRRALMGISLEACEPGHHKDPIQEPTRTQTLASKPFVLLPCSNQDLDDIHLTCLVRDPSCFG